MFKKLMKSIRRQSLKSNWFSRAVSNYNAQLKEAYYHETWARRMHLGFTVRNLKPEKLEPFDTLAIVTDDGAPGEWQGGKVVGRGYIDSHNWGGMKI